MAGGEADDSEQAIPKKGSRKGHQRQLPWRRDPVVWERLPKVERLHLAGRMNTQIAVALEVDEGTIRNDLKRLQELWLEKIKAQQDAMRAEKVAELADIKHRAIHQAEWDEFCERAVLFDDPKRPDYEMQQLGIVTELRVSRDEKGSATFRGQKAQSLNVARQAVMDQAKVLGLVIDKQELSGANGGAVPIRIVEVIPPDGSAGDDPGEE